MRPETEGASDGLDSDEYSAVYTSPVPYTNNIAIYMTKYDPETIPGKGIILAMRMEHIREVGGGRQDRGSY